jgi:hypothetical protein
MECVRNRIHSAKISRGNCSIEKEKTVMPSASYKALFKGFGLLLALVLICIGGYLSDGLPGLGVGLVVTGIVSVLTVFISTVLE